ncbi:hypothetical protein M9H77_12072 [Catharanthus roseus]|uniref:Uncharacterized protein n=1 Tax=Catharanthus roseus TaxID=4058 RepID=A0ACC0BGK4_CATRO|nr:hypothetical protein M9H77_12072 [Catharanthus roseus]
MGPPDQTFQEIATTAEHDTESNAIPPWAYPSNDTTSSINWIQIKSNNTKHVVRKRPSYGGLATHSASAFDMLIKNVYQTPFRIRATIGHIKLFIYRKIPIRWVKLVAMQM